MRDFFSGLSPALEISLPSLLNTCNHDANLLFVSDHEIISPLLFDGEAKSINNLP